MLAGVSITSIAIGFGAQSLVRDALNGIFILAENQYAKGDIVTIAGVTGTVEDVSLRRTIVRDIDGVLYSVPNGSISTAAKLHARFLEGARDDTGVGTARTSTLSGRYPTPSDRNSQPTRPTHR